MPQQFITPKQRAWEKLDWNAVNPEQIIGVDTNLFISIIAASAEIEAPIRSYAEISRNYLENIHPGMSSFVGGKYDKNGQLIEIGVWEKEERQHGPIFARLYQQLVGKKLQVKANSIKELPQSSNSLKNLYKHAIRRITTEWSAVSMYLWLMAHSTGALQQAIAQPLQDEVNHLAKFWGMTRWGFGDFTLQRSAKMIKQFFNMFEHHQGDRTTSNNIIQLNNLYYGVELIYVLARVLRQLSDWDVNLQKPLLQTLFGE